MTRPMLTVSLPTFGRPPPGGWPALPELASQAEEVGIDRVVVSDHVVMGSHTERYQWGKFPVPSDAPWMEPLTVLSAMAAVTQRIRLSTGILIAPLRPAALLAKMLATIDQLSGGRLDVGVGTGWQEEEYQAAGLPFARRGELLTETIAACRTLWNSTPAEFHGPDLSFEDIFCEPKPVQSPLPVWFSGTLTRRNCRRIVQLGDGWIPIMGATSAEIAKGVGELREELAAHGRDPGLLRVQAPPELRRAQDGTLDVRATFDTIPSLREAGINDFQVNLGIVARKGEESKPGLQLLAEEFARVTG